MAAPDSDDDRLPSARSSPTPPAESSEGVEPADEAPDRQIGRVLKATYQLEERVGVGGFGAVYRARHIKLNSAVAIKFLLPHVDQQARMRFDREARINASVVHPNVVRTIDTDHDDEGSPYIVMEWVPGVSVRKLLDEEGAFSLEETQELFVQLASAMDCAHGKGVVHRDLKPENLILTREGGVRMLKVLDFGIARLIGSTGTVTQGGAIGTPWYMAPEALGIGAPADHRADVYAMGLLLYEFLTGSRALEEEPMKILARQYTNNIVIRSVCRLLPELPDEVDDIVQQACERSPDDRFASAGAMAQALGQLKQLAPDSARRARPERDAAPASTAGLESMRLAALAVPDEEIERYQRDQGGGFASALDSAAISERPHRSRAPLVGGAVALVALVAGGAWWLGADHHATPTIADKAAHPATVIVRVHGAPPGARAYDRAHPGVAIPIKDAAIELPYSEEPTELTFEATGYERIQMTVTPRAEVDLNFTLKPAVAAPSHRGLR